MVGLVLGEDRGGVRIYEEGGVRVRAGEDGLGELMTVEDKGEYKQGQMRVVEEGK